MGVSLLASIRYIGSSSKLTLNQHVPDGKWAVVPNPGELA